MSIIYYVDVKEDRRFSDYLKEKESEGYTVYYFKNCKENLKEIESITGQINLFVSNKLFVLEDDMGIEALHFNGGADITLVLSKKSKKKTNNFKTLKFEKYSKEEFITRISNLMSDLSIAISSDIDELIDATCYYKIEEIDFNLIENYFKSKQGLCINAGNVINDFRNQGFTLEDNAFKLLNAIVFHNDALDILKDLMMTNDSHKIFGGLLFQLKQINKFICCNGDIKDTDISGYQTKDFKGYIERLGIVKIQKLNSIALEGYGIINTMPDKVLIATVVKMINYIKNY